MMHKTEKLTTILASLNIFDGGSFILLTTLFFPPTAFTSWKQGELFSVKEDS